MVGIGVDQFLRCRRRFRQNTEPRERIDALVGGNDSFRHRWPADPVKTIAAGDEVAREFFGRAIFAVVNRRALGIEVVNGEIIHFEHNLSAGIETRLDQILHHFLLRIHRDGAAVGQLSHIDAVTASAEAEPYSFMPQSFPLQARANPGFDHQVHRALFQHTGPNTIFNVLAAAAFQNNRLNAVQVQQVGKHQAGRSGPDNTDLGSHAFLTYQRFRGRVELDKENAMTPNLDQWPELPLAAWQDTYDTLHMWTQIVGKIRMTLTPLINHYWNATLYVSARGLTTSAIPYPRGIFEIEFDFIGHKLVIQTSEGDVRTLELAPRTVADFYAEVMSMLASLHIDVKITRPSG